MASPHAAGVAALVLGADPSLAPSDVATILRETGQCPDSSWADAGADTTCAGQGQWGGDPDGIAEPLVNALRAVQAAPAFDAKPTLRSPPRLTEGPCRTVSITATASDDAGVTHVTFAVNGVQIGDDSDGSDGWSASWNATGVEAGRYGIRATASTPQVNSRSHEWTSRLVPLATAPGSAQRGVDGYALLGWTGSAISFAA